MIDPKEAQRRAQLGLCMWCAEPLPGDAALHREYCRDACKLKAYRARKKAAQA